MQVMENILQNTDTRFLPQQPQEKATLSRTEFEEDFSPCSVSGQYYPVVDIVIT